MLTKKSLKISQKDFLFSNSVGPISRMSVKAIQPKCICERDNSNQALLRAKNHTRIAQLWYNGLPHFFLSFITRGVDHSTLFYDMPICMNGELCLEMVKEIICSVNYAVELSLMWLWTGNFLLLGQINLYFNSSYVGKIPYQETELFGFFIRLIFNKVSIFFRFRCLGTLILHLFVCSAPK